MMKATVVVSLASFAQGEGMCCQTCADGLQKYYSVDMAHGHCGECCIAPSQFSTFKIFEPNLTIADGSTGYSSCADLGFPTYSDTVTHGDPLKILTVTLDLYDPVDPVLASGGTCSLYEIKDDTCGQSDLDCLYVGPAKAFRSTLLDGTCAEKGYSVKTGEQTMSVPVIGDIKVTTYGKGAVLDSDEMCCQTCAEGLQKYYSVDMAHGHCGEACINPSRFWLFKVFEPNLTIADGSTGYSSCADLGWPKYSETVTHGDPLKLLTVTLDLYDLADATLASSGTCSLYEIQDGTCGQSDLDCLYVGPAKAFRSTLLDGTCAEKGYSVKTGEQTMSVPVIGDIKVTTFSKGLMLV